LTITTILSSILKWKYHLCSLLPVCREKPGGSMVLQTILLEESELWIRFSCTWEHTLNARHKVTLLKDLKLLPVSEYQSYVLQKFDFLYVWGQTIFMYTFKNIVLLNYTPLAKYCDLKAVSSGITQFKSFIWQMKLRPLKSLFCPTAI